MRQVTRREKSIYEKDYFAILGRNKNSIIGVLTIIEGLPSVHRVNQHITQLFKLK